MKSHSENLSLSVIHSYRNILCMLFLYWLLLCILYLSSSILYFLLLSTFQLNAERKVSFSFSIWSLYFWSNKNSAPLLSSLKKNVLGSLIILMKKMNVEALFLHLVAGQVWCSYLSIISSFKNKAGTSSWL